MFILLTMGVAAILQQENKHMKKLLSIAALAVFAVSCTRQVSTPSSNDNGNSINSTTVTGNFSITKFTDNSSMDDHTTDFAGYSFQFTNDGKIVATKGSFREEGSYSEKPSHEGEGAKLTISFSSDALKEISKSWLIVTITDSEIDLRDDDPSSNEVLQFSAL